MTELAAASYSKVGDVLNACAELGTSLGTAIATLKKDEQDSDVQSRLAKEAKKVDELMQQFSYDRRLSDCYVEALRTAKTQMNSLLGSNPEAVNAETVSQVYKGRLSTSTRSLSVSACANSDESYKRFRRAVWEAEHAGTNEDAPMDEDEDIRIASQSIQTMCPITRVTLSNAVRNAPCGHMYDKDAILSTFKARNYRAAKSQVKCPVTGCPKMVTKAQLKPVDPTELQTMLAQAERQRREFGGQEAAAEVL